MTGRNFCRSRYVAISLLALIASGGCDGRPTRPPEEPPPKVPPPAATSAQDQQSAGPATAVLRISRPATGQDGELEVVVELTIKPNWEIYPLSSKAPAVATNLELSLPEGITPLGAWIESPTAPSAAPDSHPVHAGTVTFTRPLKVAAKVPPQVYPIECQLSFQACNERQCLAPASLNLHGTLEVIEHPSLNR